MHHTRGTKQVIIIMFGWKERTLRIARQRNDMTAKQLEQLMLEMIEDGLITVTRYNAAGELVYGLTEKGIALASRDPHKEDSE